MKSFLQWRERLAKEHSPILVDGVIAIVVSAFITMVLRALFS